MVSLDHRPAIRCRCSACEVRTARLVMGRARWQAWVRAQTRKSCGIGGGAWTGAIVLVALGLWLVLAAARVVCG